MQLRSASDLPAVTIVPSGTSITFGELDDLSRRFAQVLRLLGLKPGERVAFLMGNQIEYPVVLIGAQRGGYDHLPLNTHATSDELTSLLAQFAPAAIVAAKEYVGLISQLSSRLTTELRRIVVGGSAQGNWFSYHELMSCCVDCGNDAHTPGKLLLLSGGSTGCPKIVERPGANSFETPRQSVTLAHVPHSSESVILVSAPLYHTGPLGWLLGGLEAGAHVIVMERWNALEQLKAVQRFKVTIMPVVPTMMSRLLELPLETRRSFDLTSLEVVSHSAAPCSTELKKRFMEWLPQLWSGYSMSEGFGLTVIGPEEWQKHPGSVGRPVPWCTITIRDELGNELSPGEIGVVWFSRCDGAKMRYLDNTEETEASYNTQGEGTAFDLGYLDKDGYLYLTGRSKNMLVVGGVNIYPSAIENALSTHPAVAEVCVVGIPHTDLGETPCAVVETVSEHASSLLEQSLKSHCRAQLGRLATPSKVIFVEELPRTPTGKVRIVDVRALANA